MSSAAGIVAANMPPAKRGESIVVADTEFSSNYFPWLLLRERGYEVRSVHFNGDGMSADAYGEVADGGTRLVAVSAVHSPTVIVQTSPRSASWPHAQGPGCLWMPARRQGQFPSMWCATESWSVRRACRTGGARGPSAIRDTGGPRSQHPALPTPA